MSAFRAAVLLLESAARDAESMAQWEDRRVEHGPALRAKARELWAAATVLRERDKTCHDCDRPALCAIVRYGSRPCDADGRLDRLEKALDHYHERLVRLEDRAR